MISLAKQRITLFINPSIVKHARAQAIMEDVTLTRLVENALVKYLPKEIIIKNEVDLDRDTGCNGEVSVWFHRGVNYMNDKNIKDAEKRAIREMEELQKDARDAKEDAEDALDEVKAELKKIAK